MKTKKQSVIASDDPEQSERFVETTKALEAGTNGDAFARAFKKIVPKKKRNRQRPTSSSS